MPVDKEAGNELLSKLSPEEKERHFQQKESWAKVEAMTDSIIEECRVQNFTIAELESLAEQLRKHSVKMIQKARAHSKI